jgi:hypothetical protein
LSQNIFRDFPTVYVTDTPKTRAIASNFRALIGLLVLGNGILLSVFTWLNTAETASGYLEVHLGQKLVNPMAFHALGKRFAPGTGPEKCKKLI